MKINFKKLYIYELFKNNQNHIIFYLIHDIEFINFLNVRIYF